MDLVLKWQELCSSHQFLQTYLSNFIENKSTSSYWRSIEMSEIKFNKLIKTVNQEKKMLHQSNRFLEENRLRILHEVYPDRCLNGLFICSRDTMTSNLWTDSSNLCYLNCSFIMYVIQTRNQSSYFVRVLIAYSS